MHFECAGVELRIRESGPPSGTPVLLLHSLFFDGSMFDGLGDRLGDAFRLICPDHRGQGASRPSRLPPEIDRLCADMLEVLERHVRAPVHLVGSSMGAYVAMRIAVRAPRWIRTCTLLGCTAEAEQDPARFARLEQTLRDAGSARIVDSIAHTMFGDTFLTDPKRSKDLEYWKVAFSRLPADIADAVHGVFGRPGFEAELAAMPVPLLLIAGAQDHAKRPDDMRRIEQAVSGSRLIVLDHSGHTPVIEQPEAVAAALTSWWALQDRVAATTHPSKH